MNNRQGLASAALSGATVLTLIDVLSGYRPFALAAMALILAYIALCWPRIGTGPRLMLGVTVLVTLFFLLGPGSARGLADAASHALYLPTLLAVMTILRVAARRSAEVDAVAHFVVSQPPGRRFAFLATAGQLFGTLLNLGGFQLLLGIALARNKAPKPAPPAPDPDKAAMEAAIAEIQQRRITNAVLRGFTAMILWSPLGVAINLLLPMLPNTGWVDYAPIGIGSMAAFLLIAWLVDRFERRPISAALARSRAARADTDTRVRGAGRAMLMLAGLLVAITGSVALAEALLGVSIRATILIVVPLAALGWTWLTDPMPALPAMAATAREGFAALPASAAEICLIGSTAVLGLVLVQMLPAEAMQALFAQVRPGAGLVCGAITLVIFLASLIGITPMITATVLVGSVLAAGIAVPEPLLMFSALLGWAAAMTVSPVTATVAIAAADTGRSPGEVGLRWNGPMVMIVLACGVLATLLVGGVR